MMMSSPRDSATSRLRQTLNPLRTTALGGFHNHMNTPHSAISITSSHTFAGLQTPASSIQPYNPQEWGPSPAVGPERTHQFPPSLSLRDPQVSAPAPPPPYSPPRSQRPASIVYETPPANISAARVPASSIHRPSPEPPANTNFPPPPGSNGRGASRERRFGLPSLTRRRDRGTPESSPPEPHPPTSLSRPQTLMVRIPDPVNITESNASIAPPSARRAASASAIDTPISARSRSTSQSRWEPGMPLPPPPPGPPPTQSRSQSLNRTTDPIVSPPTRRPPPEGVTALGPVPPTPADWTGDEPQGRGKSPNPTGLTIDTAAAASSSSSAPPESGSSSGPGSAGLNRTGAVRGEKSLRERRNESRTRHRPEDGIQPLSDILVPSGSGLSRRLSIHKGTPRSGGKTIADVPRSGDDANFDSRNSTPRPSAGLLPETPTPPFSPHPQKAYPVTEPGHPIAPKALPTPPPQSRSASNSSQARPEIHNLMNTTNPSLYPTTKQAVVAQTAEQFCRGSIERFEAFANQEAVAESDAARVKLFTDFIVNESRLRRERYASAIGAMGSEIFDLTRDLFRPMKMRRDSTNSQTSEFTPQMSDSRSQRNSMNSVFREQNQSQASSSAPASANLPPSPANGPPVSGNWNSQYMPSLSPILSMSVSEHLDESSSRGRPASRWWETESGGESNRVERTKRESKYMGVDKEAREALQWEDAPGSTSSHAGPSEQYSENEYPPEKVGWHEPKSGNASQPFRNSLLSIASSAPNTPCPSHLDVSRLVTLPPPYPRHHPAVNNNHPELASTRTLVRALSDLREVQGTKDRFKQDSQRARDEAAQAAVTRQKSLRANLHQEISSGNMSYAEAAAIEADTQVSENAKAKEVEKQEFERFQTAVVMPLNELLTGRIAQATSLFEELRSRLFAETQQAPDPNMPQEEGDEQPELLEKLTLLKWIFEAREMLHREIYDLLSDRNDRYKEMVLTPYRQSGNAEKLRTAEAFFADDADKRRVAFATEVLQRTCEFRDVVQENVVRGVDMQLNAFWDLAPPLRRLLDKIPATVDHSFRIQIPVVEFEENPSYHTHPLQYLFSLLLHAEKSTYQFIESQTNLLCLLHEVKEAVTSARAKVGEAEGRDARAVEEERCAEQTRLTDDLKEKVRVVQDQWEDALGGAMKGVKERVGEWLLSTGGWDESLEDGGVGGV